MSRALHPHAAALVGIGLRLPGGDHPDLRGPAQAWKALLAGRSAITHYPEQRWRAMTERLHPEDRTDTPWPVAHLTLPETGSLDTTVLGIRAIEGAHLSPTQTLLVQVVAEALEDAGIAPSTLAGPRTGLYVGHASPDEALNTFPDRARPALIGLSAGGAGMLATPVSRWLDTRGPLVTFDTSCSASMVALDSGRRDLAHGRVDTAIVIGTNTAANPILNRAFIEGGVLSPQGQCRPYDQDADGFVRGEAVVAVVLRRYRTARRDRDRIYAVIDHSVVGADGRSAGTGMPSATAQAELLARAYTEADVHPDAVGYLIGHGTGTQAGDAAEARALAKVFARPDHDRLRVGSLKGLWGHAEAAAGLCGVVAGALTLHHRHIPATTGHTRPPASWDQRGLQVPTGAEPWPSRGLAAPHVVGVTALGFSGGIAHTILRSAPLPSRPEGTGRTEQSDTVVLPVAAHTDRDLRSRAQGLAHTLQGSPAPRQGQVADHLSRRRDHTGLRATVISTGDLAHVGQAFEALAHERPHPAVLGPVPTPPPGKRWRPAWLFPGHGAAHPQMGHALYHHDPLFATHLDQVLKVLGDQPGAARPAWNPTRAHPRGMAALQQATFAVQVALAHTLTDRWGMRPEQVVGHSLGEVAAAHVAGILSLEDACRLVCARSALLARIARQGGMVAARTPLSLAQELAADHAVEIACRNSPTDIVFTGRRKALKTLFAALERHDAHPRMLDQAPPAHSSHVHPHLDRLAEQLGDLNPQPGHTTMVSTVTGAPIAGTDLGTDYWVRQIREPVLLEQAIIQLTRQGPTLAVELSSRPVLGGALARIQSHHHLELHAATTGLPEDEPRGLATAAAATYVHHLPVHWPYPPDAPLEIDPSTWAPAAPDRWADRIATLQGPDLAAALSEVVHAAVNDLATEPVDLHDQDTPLPDLGLNSLHQLSLRATLLTPLGLHHLPDHEPTIASIAQALERAYTAHHPSRT